MNLEKMLIGKKPRGWELENRSRNYWNKLELEISNNHTTAIVTHWTGRMVARASTQEWSIRQFLYNMTDQAALKVVGQVISQRCPPGGQPGGQGEGEDDKVHSSDRELWAELK